MAVAHKRRASISEFLRLEKTGFQALNGLALAYACCLEADKLASFVIANIFENSSARRLAIRALVRRVRNETERHKVRSANPCSATRDVPRAQSRNIALEQLFDGFLKSGKADIVRLWQQDRWADSSCASAPCLEDWIGTSAGRHWLTIGSNLRMRVVLFTILKLAPTALLRRRFEELLTSPLPPWALSRLLLDLAREEPTIVECARERDPIGYLYLCAKLQVPLREQDVRSLVSRSLHDSEYRRGLIIWALGRLGQHQLWWNWPNKTRAFMLATFKPFWLTVQRGRGATAVEPSRPQR